MSNNYKLPDNIIFIPFNVPSSKNDRVVTRGRSFAGKKTTKWRKDTKKYWLENKEKFLQLKGKQYPVVVGFHFIRSTDNNWDFPNPLQTVLDEMIKVGIDWLNDDNIHQIIPTPFMVNNKWYHHFPQNPGVFIKVFRKNEDIKINEIINIG